MKSGKRRSSQELMADLHPSLQTDYQTPEDEIAGSCGIIALELASRLYEEGNSPYVARFEPERWDDSPLKPCYLDDITWGAHLVCCADGLAYDPLVSPEPVPLADYKDRAFEESDVTMAIENSKSEIRELLKQPSYNLVRL